VHCSFDTLSHDVIHNRIIKTTIARLVRCDAVEPQLRNRLLGVYRRLHDVTPLDLCPNVFARVTLHRNNAFYGFLLHVCRLIYDNLLIDEKTGEARFKDFLRDEATMARLFERFVRNFYRREQAAFQVKSERFDWQDIAADEDSRRLLPAMTTDVSLSSSNRHIVIDTKYYVKTLQSYYASETLHSDNLYQMFAYLKNLQCREFGNRMVEGVLLYPTVSKTLDLEYGVHGHRLRVATLDLNTDWKHISQRLLGLLN
jgi:5-methylcytosine-specific restriction enzyme subunit McrC